jgi:hypothetical protein
MAGDISTPPLQPGVLHKLGMYSQRPEPAVHWAAPQGPAVMQGVAQQ